MYKLLILFAMVAVECLLANPFFSNHNVENVKHSNSSDAKNNVRIRRAITIDRSQLSSYRTVNYFIDELYSEFEVNQMKSAVSAIEAVSCLKFTQLSSKPTDNNVDYVYITPLKGCFADVGRRRGRQAISLALECLSEWRAIHEWLHALGMYHEHQRCDRDDHISVIMDNIVPTELYNFEKLTCDLADTSLPYDYHSILHYKSYEYSIDEGNLPVFESKDPNVTTDSIGGRVLSELDKQRLNKLYACDTK